MKKLLTFLMILNCSMILAQELTAESIAVEPSIADHTIKLIFALLSAGLLWLVKIIRDFVLNELKPLVSSWLKEHLHFRGSSVVADAVAETIQEISVDIIEKLNDGKLTRDELRQIQINAKAKAIPRLKNLAGFYKADLEKWVEEQVSIHLGKFLILNSNDSGSKTS